MAHTSIDLINLYRDFFGKPYNINVQNDKNYDAGLNDIQYLKKSDYGTDIFLAVTLSNPDISLEYKMDIDCVTINATRKNTIISTPVSERTGTVKEMYKTQDTQFVLKGVLIGKGGRPPSTELFYLNSWVNAGYCYLENAFSVEFLNESDRVAIISLDFPEQEGKHIRFCPFVLTLESDTVDNLYVQKN